MCGKEREGEVLAEPDLAKEEEADLGREGNLLPLKPVLPFVLLEASGGILVISGVGSSR